MKISKKKLKEIKSLWTKNKWQFQETQKGFDVGIRFPFMQFNRTIIIHFEENEKKRYYYVDTQITSLDGSSKCQETLCIEMKEHMLIHSTLMILGWIKKEKEVVVEKKGFFAKLKEKREDKKNGK